MIVATSAVALVLASASYVGYFFVTARTQLVKNLQSIADVVGINASSALLSGDPETARKTLSALVADDRVQGARLIDQEGRLFAELRKKKSNHSSFEGRLEPGIHHTDDGVIISRPIFSGHERIGQILISSGNDQIVASIQDLGIISGWVLLISLVVAVVLSTALERVISRPLLQLTTTAAKVSSSGDYHARAVRESGDELGDLIENFNEMLRQIEERDLALQEVNELLEDRVHERTEELEHEVNVRAATEQDLRNSLKEKDVLLKEIHHRVKNNLQVISSLLNLQASHVENGVARDALDISRNRLRSIALVHEMFYQSKDLSRIDLGQYLRSVTSYLLGAYGIDTRAIRVQVDCASMNVDIDTAIPLGLIAHELTSNSLKYAFPGHEHGEVRVALQKNGTWARLTVTDDGIGIPDHIQWEHPDSLGLQLVQSLTHQLKGSMELCKSETGTCVAVSIPQNLFDPGV